MRTRKPDAQRVVERSLSPESESMQKYSHEVRERIAKNTYELQEYRGWQVGQDIDDWLQAEEIVMRKVHEAGE